MKGETDLLGTSPTSVLGRSPTGPPSVDDTSPLTSPIKEVVIVPPGSFEPTAHFYPRVLNAHIHPIVRTFLSLGNDRIVKRYCHLHPEAEPVAVAGALKKTVKYLQWSGADIFVTTSERGHRKCVVVETNSCPSGQKSQPLADENAEQAGYRMLLEQSFMPALAGAEGLPEGGLAVLYDKNKMEASGYAATLADLTSEAVLLAPMFEDVTPAATRARFTPDGVLEIRTDLAIELERAGVDSEPPHAAGISCERGRSPSSEAFHMPQEEWVPIRAAVRYVTQKPWSRIPPITRTLIYNPVLACLAGGRNKMLAAKAYDLHNAELMASGLTINTPETMWNVPKVEIPLWVRRMGGMAVVKVPYANAGQGVWTIVNQQELDAFMALDQHYHSFIVQALIGNNGWSSRSASGARLYHVGTVPNARGNIHCFDLRMMVAIYARRARRALPETLLAGASSWDILGTNLSLKMEDGTWRTQTERLLLMDSRDFNLVGIGLDDLIEAYMQTCLAMAAIDYLCGKLVSPRTGRFCHKLFMSLNPDPMLLDELYLMPMPPKGPAAPETAAVPLAADQGEVDGGRLEGSGAEGDGDGTGYSPGEVLQLERELNPPPRPGACGLALGGATCLAPAPPTMKPSSNGPTACNG